MTLTSTHSQTRFQTIETTATVDEKGVLNVAPLVGVAAGEVRIFVLVALPDYSLDEINQRQWRQAMQNSSALEFLADPAEDIYTLEDGEPINWNSP